MKLKICLDLSDKYQIQSPNYPEILLDIFVQEYWLWEDLKGIVFHTEAVGDGNCFYCSLSIFLTGSSYHYWEIRAKVAEFIGKLQLILSLAFLISIGIKKAFRKDVTDGNWAKTIHSMATATQLKREVDIYK